MVNVITGGEEVNEVTYTVVKKTSKVTVTHGKRVRQVLKGDIIVFDDEDVNDALVISLFIHDTNVKRIFIDPGSSVNFILLRVVNNMQANDHIIPKAQSFSGFDNLSVIMKGEIILTMFVEVVVKDTKFQVVDADMAYNIILGRPWIHDMDAVLSTLHQVIKFPSQWGIRQIRGDQQATWDINSVAIGSGTLEDEDTK
ncbi:uncharacterized protein LOC142171790 [Nicotiana tabacum]|uniref:Uncharacterized protein LOC142171790 n=1 Tax=Nicotiana tabacum TaxID=4097 RepID=A0AC58T302_TOBAC